MHDQPSHDHIEELLSKEERPQPPTDLLAKLKAGIPDSLPAAEPAGEGAAEGPGPGGRRTSWRWLAAASVVVALGGGLLALRTMRHMETAPPSAQTEARPAAAADAREQAGVEAGEPAATLSAKVADAAPSPSAPQEDEAARALPEVEKEARDRRRSELLRGVGPAATATHDAPQPPPAPELESAQAPRVQQLPADAVGRSAAGSPVPAPAEGRPIVEERMDMEIVAPPPDPSRLMAEKPASAPAAGATAGGSESKARRNGSSLAEGDAAGAVAEAPARRLAPPPPPSAPKREAPAPRPESLEVRQSSSLALLAEPSPEEEGSDFVAEDRVVAQSAGIHPFVDAAVDARSTFGLDVDTGSYTHARAFLMRGQLPPPAAIRVEEIVNYLDYADPPPATGADFALRLEGGPTPFGGGKARRTLRFAVQGRQVEARERKPAALTFVVDTSGSMEKGGRLDLVRNALSLLLDELSPQDKVAVVSYADQAQVRVQPFADRRAAKEALMTLVPSGSTNAAAGLETGYSVARWMWARDQINRVVLISDGMANTGATDVEAILEKVSRGVDEGIELTTVGVGFGHYNDALLEQLADRANGRYAYVDRLEEAYRLFSEELTGTLQTLAGDARAQVEFHPEAVASYRLLGYENRDIADHRFRDNAQDGGEIGAGHAVTALYEIELTPEAAAGALHDEQPLATLRLRYRRPDGGEWVEVEEELQMQDLAERWSATSGDFRLAVSAAQYAEILRRSSRAAERSARQVRTELYELPREVRSRKPTQDLLDLVERLVRLAGGS